MSIQLTGKRAIVAGGAGAIGLAAAEALADAGAQVTVLDIAIETAASDPRFEARQIDLCDTAALRQCVREVADAGGLDIAVHAAGVHRIKPIEELTEDDWDTVQAVNLRSAFFLAQAAIASMRARGGGSIILVSSCSARLAYPGLTPYCASKAGMEGMIRGLACDAARFNVRVNGIAPGTTKTPMTRHLWGDPTKDAGHKATIPLNRLAEPRDIAHACLFLGSDLASYITGAVLPVDGGLTAMQADFIDLPLRDGE